jgi:GDP-D-mannose dehydratase
VLITGITGFVGSHLAEYALSRDAEVFGSRRWRSKTENIDHLRDRITLIECDLRDLSSVQYLLDVSSPDRVYHLAAQSFVQVSWHTPAETLNTNSISQVNLRPSDVPVLVGDASKLHKATGWRPEIPFEQTLRDLLQYWRARVGSPT